MSRVMFRRGRLAGAVVGVLLVAASCGGDDSSSGGLDGPAQPGGTEAQGGTDSSPGSAPDTVADSSLPPAGSFPVTVSGAAGDVTLEAAPTRILSLSPTHTEMLWAIGADDQVVAVDSLSTYPPETADKVTDLSAYAPNVEAIAGYEPDVVVIGDDSSGISEQLEGLGIPVWFGPAAVSFDDVYTQIEQLGALTGNVAEAASLVGEMTTDIDEIVAAAPRPAEPLTYYHELDDTYYSMTSNTFIGQVYSLLGLRNIADTTEGQTDYPQLSAEFIVSQDPDLIFLADTICCGQSAETVAARPGWEDLAAVRNGTVMEMNDDVASRWGPRIVDYLRDVAAAVDTAVAAQQAG